MHTYNYIHQIFVLHIYAIRRPHRKVYIIFVIIIIREKRKNILRPAMYAGRYCGINTAELEVSCCRYLRCV